MEQNVKMIFHTIGANEFQFHGKRLMKIYIINFIDTYFSKSQTLRQIICVCHFSFEGQNAI